MKSQGKKVITSESEASISVFFCLTMLIMLSLIFSMLETIRILEMNVQSQVITKESLQSAFSEYNRVLWEEYRILGVDATYGMKGENTELIESRMLEFAYENTKMVKEFNGRENHTKNADFFHIEPVDVRIKEYGLLTDDDGQAIIAQGIHVAKSQFPMEVVSAWKNKFQGMESASPDDEAIDACVQEGKKALIETVKEANQSDTVSEAVIEKETVQTIDEKHSETDKTQANENVVVKKENPFEIYTKLKQEKILALVASDIQISQKEIGSIEDFDTSYRWQGTYRRQQGNIDDIVWLMLYLQEHFGYFGKVKSGHALDYELEYIVGEKQKDSSNLEKVVEQLQLLRQLANMATIYSSPNLLQETYEMATALAGASANAVVIQSVQLALVVIWAYIESLLDIRALLHGKTIAMIKGGEEWSSSLRNLGEVLQEGAMAKENKKGISYSQYLTVMIAKKSTKEIGRKMLHLVEQTIQQKEYMSNCQLDHFMWYLEVEMEYDGKPLFFSYVGRNLPSLRCYRYRKKQVISYL